MDDEPMWVADRVVALTPGSAITIPKIANEFAIKEASNAFFTYHESPSSLLLNILGRAILVQSCRLCSLLSAWHCISTEILMMHIDYPVNMDSETIVRISTVNRWLQLIGQRDVNALSSGTFSGQSDVRESMERTLIHYLEGHLSELLANRLDTST
ncbi:hypothetical protein Tco_0260683 [Tanacetum coccineum]